MSLRVGEATQPLRQRIREHALNQVLRRLGNGIFRESISTVHYSFKKRDLINVVVVEGRLSEYHLVHKTSEGPVVGPLVMST